MRSILRWLSSGRAGASERQASESPLGPWIGHAGFELDVAAQLALLDELRGKEYQEAFAALRSDVSINAGLGGVDYAPRGLIHNGYFPTPDAELYGAMILRTAPHEIVEVGSGFSTRVARAMVDHGGFDCRLRAIDPAPRADITEIANVVELKRVERSSLAASPPPSGSILFIDSSHLVTSGGDGPFLYCELLPRLPPDVLVHIHDIFLPYDYPPVYQEWGYAEQYLLHALLSGSRKFEVVFATLFMCESEPEAIRATFGPEAGTGLFRGASFWMRSVR